MGITKLTTSLIRHAGYLLSDWLSLRDNSIADISSPKWGAPQGQAASLASSKEANTAAIQRMLDSGITLIQLDGVARYVGTLYISKPITLRGVGRSQVSLIYSGEDAPMISTRRDWANPNALGQNNVRIENLRALDTAVERKLSWFIDMTNGHSCSIYNSFIDFPEVTAMTDKYGVALGFAKGSNLIGTSVVTFVCEVSRSRFVNGKVVMNTSDYYITQNELWGTGRDYALELGFGGIVHGNMIVPGLLGGSYHFSDRGFDHDTMSYQGNYFDGSTNPNIFTGTGIVSDVVGLRDANINGNRFWFLNKSGISVPKMYGCNVTANSFKDCDSDDTGDDDIICPDIYGGTIQNTHTRTVAAPKTGNNRVNLGRTWDLVGKVGYPPTILDGVSNFANAYRTPSIVNPSLFDLRGIGVMSSRAANVEGSPLNFPNKIIVVDGLIKVSTGASWLTVNPRVSNITTPFNMDNLADGVYSLPDPTIATQIPSGLTGDCRVTCETINNDPNFRMQTILKLDTGKWYSRKRQAGTWRPWSA